MERIAYIPLIILCIVGLIYVSFAIPESNFTNIEFAEGTTSVADIKSGKLYELSLKDDSGLIEERDVLDTLFWDITGPDSIHTYIYQLSPVRTFKQTGPYIIDTYQPQGRLLATDTIYVKRGEYIDFKLANSSITEGEEAIAYNHSTYEDARHEWAVLTDKGNELLLDNNDTLRLNSLVPGSYAVKLRLFDRGDTISAQKDLFVNEKKPLPKPKPRPKPEPKPEEPRPKIAVTPTPKPKPKPEPVVKEKPMDGWYSAAGGSGKFIMGPAIPKKNTEQFSGGTTVLQIKPKQDVQLSEFSFWGNHKTGNYSIEYECTSCEDESQKRLRPMFFRTGNDFYDPQTRRLSSKRIGFLSGHTYKLTFTTQESTQMQFEKLGETRFENENLSLEFLTDRSCIFKLTFLKR